ncbi:TM2 domain-containing protein 1, partial [Fragariocoptes setiger]
MPDFPLNCSQLLVGQYSCQPIQIDVSTQQPVGCTLNNTAFINCTLNPGLVCQPNTGGLNETAFQMPVPCEYTNGCSFETTLLLAVFLGMFGADRFYLGYYGIGLLKLCTFGFMMFGQLLDIILIALQIVGPADGSHYVISYFGPKISILAANSETQKVSEL